MALSHNRSIAIRTSPQHRLIKPLDRLERVQTAYFFTPDLEREIDKLDGVTSARVLSTGTEIDEIHVIATRDRTPKKLVRDIESLLLVRFGMRIDHRKISVVQMGQLSEESAAPSRPTIEKIEKKSSDGHTSICVEIRVNGSFISGVGSHLAHETDLHASSRALINSIEKLLHTQGALALQEVTVIETSGQRIVLAVLSWTLEGHEEILVGATVARGDPLEDAARATFDAVNRKLVRINQARRARA